MSFMILEILLHTPSWVYALFIYLAIRGIQSLYPTTASLHRLTYMPSIFTAWSLYSLYQKYHLQMPFSGLWIIAFIFGLLIGWYLFSYVSIRIDKNNNKIHLPGSWYPLLLSLAFFSIKYGIGVAQGIHPILRTNTHLMLLDVGLSAFINGLFWARFLRIYKKAKS